MVGPALQRTGNHFRHRLTECRDHQRVEQGFHLNHAATRRRPARIDKTADGSNDLDRLERTVIDGCLRIQKRLRNRAHGIRRHRRSDIRRAPSLRSGAGEIRDHAVAVDRELQAGNDRLVIVAVGFDVALCVVDAVRTSPDPLAHHLLRAPHQLVDRRKQFLNAETREQALDMLLRLARRAEHGLEIAAALGRITHVLKQEFEKRFVQLPLLADARGDNTYALLENFRDAARQTPRGRATHVAPMAARRSKQHKLPARKYGIEHEHVVQMGAARIGIVVKEYVSFMNVAAEHADDLARGMRHGKNVKRIVVERLREQPAIGADQRAGEVVTFVDNRRVRGMDDVRAHLFHDRDEGLAHQFQYADVLVLFRSGILPGHRRFPLCA